MSKKAKTASKNNPTGRKAASKYIYNNKEIRPTRIVGDYCVMGAEYVDNSQLVCDKPNQPMSWRQVRELCEII